MGSEFPEFVCARAHGLFGTDASIFEFMNFAGDEVAVSPLNSVFSIFFSRTLGTIAPAGFPPDFTL